MPWNRTLIIIALYVVSGFSRTVFAQQYTFEEVASGLKHQDAATRLRAIQILKDADYAEAAAPIAEALADADDRVQLAAIDAERSLFTTRPVARRRKIGFVVEVRTVAGGEAAAAGQLALKARTVPRQLLTSLAVALRDSNPRVRAEAINLASVLGPYACATVRLKPDPTDVRFRASSRRRVSYFRGFASSCLRAFVFSCFRVFVPSWSHRVRI
jgi:HEAT repeat protein